MDFRLRIKDGYFNATDLVAQHNMLDKQTKRMHSFTSTGKRNSEFARLFNLRQPPVTKITGSGVRRATWFRLALIHAFLLWLNKDWAAQLAVQQESPEAIEKLVDRVQAPPKRDNVRVKNYKAYGYGPGTTLTAVRKG